MTRDAVEGLKSLPTPLILYTSTVPRTRRLWNSLSQDLLAEESLKRFINRCKLRVIRQYTP